MEYVFNRCVGWLLSGVGWLLIAIAFAAFALTIIAWFWTGEFTHWPLADLIDQPNDTSVWGINQILQLIWQIPIYVCIYIVGWVLRLMGTEPLRTTPPQSRPQEEQKRRDALGYVASPQSD